VNTLSCLVDRSAGNDLLQRAATVGQVTAGRPSQRQRLRLVGLNTPSAHLIPAADRQMNGSCLMMSRGLVHRRRGLGPPRRGPIPPVF
jgi:hypothetical protein